MAIRTRTSDGYQQVELTSELLHSQSGATQQVISTVPCSKHLPFFFAILLADVLLFGAVILFALYATHFADGFSYVQQPEAPLRQFNLHALIMITALVYLNGQAITVYKSNYLVKHKSLNMLYHFVLHLLTVAGVAAGLYMSFSAQEATQAKSGKPSASHFYSLHSWAGLATVLLFAAQFLFGFFSFFVTLCCRKLTARWRARALPAHRVLAMFVLCGSLIAVVSGLTQLARFQLDGREGRANYGDLSAGGLLVNLSGLSALLAAALIFLITFVFKRRQAHDLPVLFKMVLLVSQFVELVLILVVAEFIFQLVTPHVNRAINEHFATSNATLTHIFNNATRSISTFIASASQHFSSAPSSSSGGQQAPADTPTELLNRSSTILLGSNATGS